MRHIPKPNEGEYAPYASVYINLIPGDGQVLTYMNDNLQEIKQLTANLSEDQLLYQYAPGKWTIKQILQHIMDAERVFSYRALAIARGDKTPLPGFSENDYAAQAANANNRSINELLEEYELVRRSSLALFNSFDNKAFDQVGTANNVTIGVRALPYYCAGHEKHHITIMKERYLK